MMQISFENNGDENSALAVKFPYRLSFSTHSKFKVCLSAYLTLSLVSFLNCNHSPLYVLYFEIMHFFLLDIIYGTNFINIDFKCFLLILLKLLLMQYNCIMSENLSSLFGDL